MALRDYAAKLLYFLIYQATVINSCTPGLGTIGSGPLLGNPKFTFSVSPPLDWTYHVTTGTPPLGAGQSVDAATAQKALDQDVNSAVLSAFFAFNMVGTYSLTNQLTPAPDILGPAAIAPGTACGQTAGVNNGCTVGGTMMGTLGTVITGTPTPYILTLNVEVQTPIRMNQAQWQLLGQVLLASLAASANAVPRSAVTVIGTSF